MAGGQYVRTADLCSGYGGLVLALDALGLGFETVLFAEKDKDASRILAHHWPEVPNVGDLWTVDWTPWIGRVDAVVAGYNCQPFSTAGQRKGHEDERNVWPAIWRAVWALRPSLVLLENVSAHLSLGFDVVLGDLAALGFDAEWGTLAAADVGASHGRRRLFIVAWAAATESERAGVDADRRVRGRAARGRRGPGRPAVSPRPQVALAADAEPSGAGAAADANVLRLEGIDVPRVGEGVGAPRDEPAGGAAEAPALLPTPRTGPNRASRRALSGIDQWSAPGLEQVAELVSGELPREYEDAGEIRGRSARLLPTPTAADGEGGRHATNLIETDGATLMRPSGAKASVSLRESLDLLPTPASRDWKGPGSFGPEHNHGRGNDDLPTAARNLPTPTARVGSHGGSAEYRAKRWADTRRSNEIDDAVHAENWGVFAAAIARWETVLGRRAPDALADGKLSVLFVEWLMGLAEGHVTARGLSRTATLRILGNGVVPLQATVAYLELLERAGLLEAAA